MVKSSDTEFIIIGKVLSPRGNKGKIKVEVATDFPERFSKSSNIYVNKQPVTIESVEWHSGKVIIKLDTINSIKDAEKLRGQYLEIHRDQPYQLPEDSYYHFQLIGLEVQTINGDVLGKITDILTGSSNDIYVVSGDRGEILVPAIEDIIKSVNLKEGILIIEPIEGLLNLNTRNKNRSN